MAAALVELGSKHGVVVCGSDGLDEVTLSGETLVSRATERGVTEIRWNPEEFGINAATLDTIKVSSAEQSA